MKTYRFTVALNGVPDDGGESFDDVSDALFAVGCDDCTPIYSAGMTGAMFSRDAKSLESAIATAVADIKKAGYDVEEVTIERSCIPELAA